MIATEHERAVLHERAQQLARADAETTDHTPAFDVAIVGVGDERFGIIAAELRELTALRPITRLPGLPPWLLGLCQLRGELMSVVDLDQLLQLESARPRTHVAVLDTERGPLALAVERVLGFRSIYREELNETETELPIRYVTRDLIHVLDVERLISRAAAHQTSTHRSP